MGSNFDIRFNSRKTFSIIESTTPEESKLLASKLATVVKEHIAFEPLAGPLANGASSIREVNPVEFFSSPENASKYTIQIDEDKVTTFEIVKTSSPINRLELLGKIEKVDKEHLKYDPAAKEAYSSEEAHSFLVSQIPDLAVPNHTLGRLVSSFIPNSYERQVTQVVNRLIGDVPQQFRYLLSLTPLEILKEVTPALFSGADINTIVKILEKYPINTKLDLKEKEELFNQAWRNIDEQYSRSIHGGRSIHGEIMVALNVGVDIHQLLNGFRHAEEREILHKLFSVGLERGMDPTTLLKHCCSSFMDLKLVETAIERGADISFNIDDDDNGNSIPLSFYERIPIF